jgi:uncharacterized lipoprotein YmbA
MKTVTLKAFLIFVSFAILGCSSKTPEDYTYLLASPVLTKIDGDGNKTTIQLGNIHLANYLTGRGLILDMGENRVVSTKQHRWAESLDQSIRRVLKRSLNSEVFRIATEEEPIEGDDLILTLEIDAFQSRAFDSTYATGKWTLRSYRTGLVVEEQYFDVTADVRNSNYRGIVNAHERMLATLSNELIAKIEQYLASIEDA